VSLNRVFHFFVFIIIQALVVMYVFPWIHTDFKVRGGAIQSLWIVIGFIVLNWIVRWVFVLFTFGIGWLLYYVSLGLLGLVANAFVLILISRLFPQILSVPNFMAAFWGGLCLALTAFIMRR